MRAPFHQSILTCQDHLVGNGHVTDLSLPEGSAFAVTKMSVSVSFKRQSFYAQAILPDSPRQQVALRCCAHCTAVHCAVPCMPCIRQVLHSDPAATDPPPTRAHHILLANVFSAARCHCNDNSLAQVAFQRTPCCAALQALFTCSLHVTPKHWRACLWRRLFQLIIGIAMAHTIRLLKLPLLRGMQGTPNDLCLEVEPISTGVPVYGVDCFS